MATVAKVLLADDDPEYRAAFSRAMEALGHTVTVVASGTEVAAAIDRAVPDIVFLDVLMPDGGAISRVHEVRQQLPDTPVVVITGNAAIYASPIVTEGMRGADMRLPKSVSLLELSVAIDTLTGGAAA